VRRNEEAKERTCSKKSDVVGFSDQEEEGGEG